MTLRRRARHRLVRTASAAGALALLLLGVQVDPSLAQLATITFPETVVGSASTVKCPTTSISICFGENCSASGTVQSVSGPSAPFSVGKFSLLSSAEFFGGLCEAHPVSLPVSIGPGQILAYQATFAPTAAETSNGSLTFTTGGGTATVNLTGKGLAPRADRGGVLVMADPGNIIPGGVLNLQYRTSRGTLQGNVDLYFVIVFASGEYSFVTEQGGLTAAFVPMIRNLSITDATQQLFGGPFPLDMPFGTYAFYSVLVHAGADATNSQNWASPLTSASVAYAALTPEQAALKASRGNPDALTVSWLPALNQKRETWMYLSGSPNQLVFVNGALESATSVSLSPADIGPKLDPALFTPQTTLASLTAVLGPPTSVAASDAAPGFQLVGWAFGLDVVLLNGRLSSAVTSAP
jgi:hypothetical protein